MRCKPRKARFARVRDIKKVERLWPRGEKPRAVGGGDDRDLLAHDRASAEPHRFRARAQRSQRVAGRIAAIEDCQAARRRRLGAGALDDGAEQAGAAIGREGGR